MILLTDGDSWTWGCEISSPHMLNIQDPEGLISPNRFKEGYADYHPENDEYRTSRIWPTLLSKSLGMSLVNIAWPARSNDSIIQCTTAWILKYLKDGGNPNDLFVVVGFSSPERKNIILEDTDNKLWFQTFWPAMQGVDIYQTPATKKYFNFYVSHLFLEIEYLERFITQCFNLHLLLKNHNIKHLFFNAFFQYRREFYESFKEQNIHSLLDELSQLNNIAGWSEGTYLFSDRINHLRNMWNFIDDKNFLHKDTFKSFKAIIEEKVSTKDSMNNMHPSPLGHTIFSEYLKPYVEGVM